jgi:DNA-binding NtrC family response regulator
LVGYRRGAFTGAYEHHAGKLETAHGGTLFLDEIGLASGDVQRALLQFVDTGIVQRMGESRERPVDARLVFATNEDLERLVEAGRFRADLFFRLGQFIVRMPALAERPEDIPGLVEYLLAAQAARYGRPTPRLSTADIERLVAHPWPGNVRQLAGTVEQIVVYNKLPDTLTRAPISTGWRTRTKEALARCGGNKAAAARLLGVSRQALHQELRAHGG